ncbi:MAG: hypothetical protein ABEK04_04715 [Candidatus Nanohalobium sp.]
MPDFVCPICEEEISDSDEQALVGEAMDHMVEEHDKDNITEEYIKEDIEAHA